MHAGRKSPLARAYKEHAEAERRRAAGAPPVDFEAFLAGFQRPTISRRDVLRAGGILGAGAALSACTPSSPRSAPSPTSPGGVLSTTPHIVDRRRRAGRASRAPTSCRGAGRHRARSTRHADRLGGRCWTSRGWAARPDRRARRRVHRHAPRAHPKARARARPQPRRSLEGIRGGHDLSTHRGGTRPHRPRDEAGDGADQRRGRGGGPERSD